MKNISVPHVYIAYDKIRTGEEKERAERLLKKISGTGEARFKEERILEILKAENWYEREHRTGQKREGNPKVVLTAFNWEDEVNRPRKQYRESLPGRFAFADFRDKKQLRKEKGAVCNTGYEIHTTFGCLHSCAYCHVGNALTIMLDIEKFIEKLGALMVDNPWQKLYKYDNQGDVLTLEPEYGATKKLVEFFAKTNKTLMLYTKSDNVDFLLDLEHNGRTRVCWTISCEDVVEKYEHGAASLEERIEAAGKCQKAGYVVRFRFSPIIPVKNWKEKNAAMIKEALSRINPEVICLETLCHMTREQYDEVFTGLECEPASQITEYELFTHDARREIYKFFIDEIRKYDTDAKVSLCLETEKMWKDLRKLLKGTPDNFYCCCGAQCA